MILVAVALVVGCANVGGAADDRSAAPERSAEDGPKISNAFLDADLRQALSDVAVAAKVAIIAEEGVQGTVSVELDATPLEQALDLLLLAGGYMWERVSPGVYCAYRPDARSTTFLRLARTERVSVQHLLPEVLRSVLPESVAAFMRFENSARAVYVTAPPRLLERLVAEIHALDKPSDEGLAADSLAVVTVQLSRATAKEVVKYLPASAASALRVDDTTNTVVLEGPPGPMAALAQQLRALDVAPTQSRLIPVDRLEPGVLVALLPAGMRTTARAVPGVDAVVVEAPPAMLDGIAETVRQLDGAAPPRGTLTTMTIPLNYADAETVTELLPEQYKALVKVDKAGTQAVVMAPPAQVEQVVAYLKQIDQPPLQIMIEALVIESVAGALDRFSAKAASQNFGLNNATGLLTWVDKAQDMLVELLALVEKNQAAVKASPRVVAQEGREANVRVATEQYFRIVTARQNYDYVELQAIEAAIGLTITPKVADADRMVTCKIMPEVGDVSATSADNLPVITKRTATTTVRVRDGGIIAIGGLLEELERTEKSKIPILGDLPLVGGLFQSSRKEKSQREVTIFIVPHILDANGAFEGQPLLDQLRGEGRLPAARPEPTPQPVAPGTAPALRR